MDHFTHRVVGFGVQRGVVAGPALCRMFNDATSGPNAPRYVSTDHDLLFGFRRWRANLRVLEIDEVKTVPYTPMSHLFIERLFGTIRRELLDHGLFWNTLDLQRKLAEFRTYYNGTRVHSSLSGNPPADFATSQVIKAAEFANVHWYNHCRSLVPLPVAA